MPSIDVRQIDEKYHLWMDGELLGVYDDLAEVSKVFMKDIIPIVKEEQENERTVD